MKWIDTGIVVPGESKSHPIVLEGEITYVIYVEPSIEGVDFDLHVFDQNGNLVEQDIDETSDALCMITPRWTGPFALVVSSAVGTSDYTISVLSEDEV